MSYLKELQEDLKKYKESMSQMQAVQLRLHIGYDLIAVKLGAIAWCGSSMSTWASFVMPDMTVKFGNVSSPSANSECVVDVSSIDVFEGITKELAFEPSHFRSGIPDRVNDLTGYVKTLNHLKR